MRIVSSNVLDLEPGLARARMLERRLQMEWGTRLARWREIQDKARPRHGLGDFLLILAVLIGLGSMGVVVKNRARKRCGGIPAYKSVPEISNLTRLWWQATEAEAQRIDQQMAGENSKHGDTGELMLMDARKYSLPDSYFRERGWKRVEGLDNDVLVFGPNGIWMPKTGDCLCQRW